MYMAWSMWTVYHACTSMALCPQVLATGPSPLFEERYLLFAHVQNISVKWKIILAKNTELSFAIDSSSDLTCRTLLEYYFSDVGVPFSKRTVKQKSNKLIC